MGFLLAKATIDGQERFSVIAESALPHLPQWTAVDPADVRKNPWDFEEPEPDTALGVGPPPAGNADQVGGTPDPAGDGTEAPAGNASAAEWRTYAETRDLADAASYSRDELRDHYLNDQPLPSKETDHG